MRAIGFALLFLFASTTASLAEPVAVFETLKSLVGEWQGQTASGRTISVSYRTVANGSVLVEDWRLSPTRESLTLYHMDNGTLMATHYCPLGNQPRLTFAPDPAHADRFDFVFRDATNLARPADAHQHAFWIRLNADGSFDRSETYLADGEPGEETVRYRRVN